MNKKRNKNFSSNISDFVDALHQNQIIAYPTESVFGLGCDPDNEIAVRKLCSVKNRSLEKGLILVAYEYEQLLPYIQDECLSEEIRKKIFSFWPGHITWTIPASRYAPKWITGKFSSLAVRVSNFDPIKRLCLEFGKPLVSSSANLQGRLPTRSSLEVQKHFGNSFLIMEAQTEGRSMPSEIRDALSDRVIRKGRCK